MEYPTQGQLPPICDKLASKLRSSILVAMKLPLQLMRQINVRTPELNLCNNLLFPNLPAILLFVQKCISPTQKRLFYGNRRSHAHPHNKAPPPAHDHSAKRPSNHAPPHPFCEHYTLQKKKNMTKRKQLRIRWNLFLLLLLLCFVSNADYRQ